MSKKLERSNEIGIGDQLFTLCDDARAEIWQIGRIVTLVLESIMLASKVIGESSLDTYKMDFPIGLHTDEQIMTSKHEVDKNDLVSQLDSISSEAVPVSAAYNIVTIVESFLNDVVRACCIAFPKKIPSNEKVSVGSILNCSEDGDFHRIAVDQIVGKLSYLSPSDYADQVKKYISISLSDIPAWHEFVELKATRDIHIHNKGIVNEIYLQKTSTSARGKLDTYLPVPAAYLWRKYEACIKLTEELQEQFYAVWPSALKIAQLESDVSVSSSEIEPKPDSAGDPVSSS